MNTDILNNMPEYVKNLPKAVQDLVFDSAWEERTAEIAKKYSLNDTQADDLINTVLFVLIGLESPDTFLETIITDLGISRLLAEQIMEDLEVRVFEYALRTVEKKTEKVVSNSVEVRLPQNNSNQEKPMSRRHLDIVETKPKVPEVKPDNLPMIEIGEIAHDNPSPRQPLGQIPKVEPLKSNSQGSTFGSNAEPVQRPVEVPRFTGVPIEEDVPSPTLGVGGNKIPSKIEPAKLKHKYAVDPYREAIE